MREFILTWSNITVSIKKQNRSWFRTKKEEKIILNNASGSVCNGSFVAVMGPSGAGKTTLLATLGGLTKDFKGSICINDRKLSNSEIKQNSGFMHQFFMATESLTTKEHLMFMIALKGRIHSGGRLETLQKLMNCLSLESCKDTQIRFLSGGEKKKVALAVEVLNDPLLLFCDEPTTGLDSSSAVSIMELLHSKATSGKIVMFTIHQPSSELYKYFDHIVLLASGKLILEGTRNIMQDFFNSINLVCPKSYNPAEFYVKCLISKNTEELEDLQEKASYFKNRSECSTLTHSTADEPFLYSFKAQHSNLVQETGWLIWRSYVNGKRNLKNFFGGFSVTLVIAVILNILFSGTSLNDVGVQSYDGVLYMTATEMVYTLMYTVLYTFPEEYGIYLAEQSTYSSYSYFISKVLAIIPRCTIDSLSFLSIVYSSVKLPGGFYQFGKMFLICTLASFSGALFGLSISANFRAMDNIASVVVPWNLITTLMAGIFIKITTVATCVQWLKYLSPFYYAYQSLAIIHWIGVTDIGCPRGHTLPCYKNGVAVLESLGFTPSYSQVYRNMLFMTILTVCFALIGLFGITRKYKV